VRRPLLVTSVVLLVVLAGTLQVAESRLEPSTRYTIAEQSARTTGPAAEPAPSLQYATELPDQLTGATYRDAHVDPVVIPTDPLVWERENGYINAQNFRRQRASAVRSVADVARIFRQVTSPEDVTPESTRILAVGDSYVYGYAVADLEHVWPRQLQTELNARSGPGAWRVDLLGQGARSFLDYAEWLSPDVIESYDPDAIVIGWLWNDMIPSGFERALCGDDASVDDACSTSVRELNLNRAFLECIAGDDRSIVTAMVNGIRTIWPRVARWIRDRYCNPHRLRDESGLVAERTITMDPTQNPYLPLFLQAVEHIRIVADGRPVFIKPSPRTLGEQHMAAAYDQMFTAAGFVVLPVPTTDSLLADGDPAVRTWTNPADPHPGPDLVRAFARDVADGLEQHGLRPGPDRVALENMELVSNFQPYTMRTTQLPGGGRRFLQPAELDSTELEAVGRNTMRGESSRLQFSPCAWFGRPHAFIGLNPERFVVPTRVQVTLRDSEDSTLVVAVASYGGGWQPRLGPVRELQRGGSVVIDVPAGASQILLGAARGGCPNESELRMEGFVLDITPVPTRTVINRV